MNKHGSEIISKKPIYNEVDMFWDNLVLSVIGETLEETDEICGCRVVEKCKKKDKPYYRLEVWLKSDSVEISDKLKQKLTDILVFSDNASAKSRVIPPEFDLKVHFQ